jgi:hypothetical protein
VASRYQFEPLISDLQGMQGVSGADRIGWHEIYLTLLPDRLQVKTSLQIPALPAPLFLGFGDTPQRGLGPVRASTLDAQAVGNPPFALQQPLPQTTWVDAGMIAGDIL